MPVAPEIERLTIEQLSENVTLSRSVGWTDVEAEWRVLHTAADVFGMREAGSLRAQVALADYGCAVSNPDTPRSTRSARSSASSSAASAVACCEHGTPKQ